MQWAIAFTLILTYVFAFKRKLNVVEETPTKTTLHILDDNIVEYIKKPSVQNSRMMCTDIASYNSHFKEIIDGFQDRKFRFVRIAHVIYEKGGPNFMKLRIDGPIFLKMNGWTMNDMGEFYYLLKGTHRLWLEFKTIYEEVKTAVKGNWTQLKTIFPGVEAPGNILNVTAMIQSIADTNEQAIVNITLTTQCNNETIL